MPGTTRLDGLDGLRALAVLMVLISHVFDYGAGKPNITLWGYSISAYLNCGHAGVQIFFALSGFVLALPWAKSSYAGLPAPNIRQYASRRLRRIMPAYLAALAVLFFLLAPLNGIPLLSSTWLIGVGIHFFQLQGVVPLVPVGIEINPVLWSLSIEMCFYVVLPFIVAQFVGKNAAWWLAFALFISLVWRWSMAHLGGYDQSFITSFYYSLPGQLFNFSVGMVAARVFLMQNDLPSKTDVAYLTLVVIAILFLCIGLTGGWVDSYEIFPAVNAICALLVLLVATSNPVSRVLFENPLAMWLGKLSYSIFLWHFMLLWILKEQFGISNFFLLITLLIPAVVAVSYASWRLFEFPFQPEYSQKTLVFK